MAPRKKAAAAELEAIDPQVEAPAPKKAAAAPPKPDTFVGEDGRTYRRIHVQKGSHPRAPWIDKTELVG